MAHKHNIDIRAELEHLIHDVQKQIDSLNEQLRELTETDRQIVVRIQRLSKALMSYSDKAKQLLNQKLELETEIKKKENEKQKQPIPSPFKTDAQNTFAQNEQHKTKLPKQQNKTTESKAPKQIEPAGQNKQNHNSTEAIEQTHLHKAKEISKPEQIRKEQKRQSEKAVHAFEQNEPIAVSNSTIVLLGPKADVIDYMLRQQESANAAYGIRLLQQKQIEQELKYIREQIKLIRSELYMLKEILDTLVAKERILLSERNQLYKIASDTRQKLLQLDKEAKDTNSLLSEIKQKVEELNRRTNLNVFEQNEAHNQGANSNESKLQPKDNNQSGSQEQKPIGLDTPGNMETIGQELLEQDPFEYARQFTKRVNTLDTDALETDDTETLT